MREDIYSEQYKFEWELRGYLLSATSLAIALATIVGGALAALTRLYSFSNSAASYAAAFFLAAAAVALGYSVYSIYRGLSGYEYARVPGPTALRAWRNDLVNWHKGYGTIEQVDADFEEGFLSRLGSAIEVNWANNKRRSVRIYRANMATALAAVFLIAPGALYVLQDFSSVPRPHAVEIVSGKLQISGDEDNGE